MLLDARLADPSFLRLAGLSVVRKKQPTPVTSLPEEPTAHVLTALARNQRYLPQTPTPKQAAFLALPDREAFYGGAAGGGKSSALLMAALMYVDVPGYAAVLFRRTYADLSKPEALMDRAHSWLGGTDARWNGQEHAWRFPSGARLVFSHLEHEQSKYDHQSAAYQFCGFDELTAFTESQYLYLFSRLRRLEHLPVPLRMRSASNPGNIGHRWVKKRFLTDGPSLGRPYIPAQLEDNPYLDHVTYEANLAELDQRTERQLRHGDWTDTVPGALWTYALLDQTRVVLAEVPDLVRVGVALDPAATSQETSDEMGIVAGGRGTDGHGYTLRDVSLRGTPTAAARQALLLYDALEADVMIGEANNGGEWIGTVIKLVAAEMARTGERASAEVNYKMVHASRGKQTRAEPISTLFAHGRAHHVGTFPELESQMTGWVPGMKSPDRMDAAVWLYTELILVHKPPPVFGGAAILAGLECANPWLGAQE